MGRTTDRRIRIAKESAAVIRVSRQKLGRMARRFGLQSARSRQAAAQALAEYDGMLDVLSARTGTLPCTSKAQLKQDMAALVCTGFKRGGFFIDIGAADPVQSSNTVMLERSFGWTGICAEPNPVFHDALRAQRRCAVDERCVWTTTGDIKSFHFSQANTLSTLSEFVSCDHHADARAQGRVGSVETVSLNDLLLAHGAPPHVDFLSMDTEGSELAILNAFNFESTTFGFISIEHNYAPNRAAIHDLLVRKGYMRIWTRLSAWDDWYIPITAGQIVA